MNVPVLLPEWNLGRCFIICRLLIRKDKGESPVRGKVLVSLKFLIFVYRHLPHDDNATNFGDNVTTEPHSTALLYTFEDPLLL